jgi:predicted metal-dependent HD superfamily phosphohydrolase
MNREELAAAYAAPSRYYHNLAHVEDCLAALVQVSGLSAHERDILTEAIW